MASVYWQVLLMLRIESSCSAGWGGVPVFLNFRNVFLSLVFLVV
jgi:hypothetical protein